MKAIAAFIVIVAIGILGVGNGLASPDTIGQRAVRILLNLPADEEAANLPLTPTHVERSFVVALKSNRRVSATPNRYQFVPGPAQTDKLQPANSHAKDNKMTPPASREPSPGRPIPIPYPNLPPPRPKPCVPFTICSPETLPLPSPD